MLSANFNPKIDPVRALAMYDEGASDREIAVACGVSRSGVCYWRKRCGLTRVACNDNRLTATQIRRAKNMLRNGATRAQIAAHLGVSRDSVQQLRREMDDPRLRRTGINGNSIRKAVIADKDLPQRIEKAIGRRVPSDIRMEAFNDMYADLLDGILTVSEVETAASKYRSQAFEMAGFNHSTRSIYEEDENGFSLAEQLADPRSLRPYEEILERHFGNDN